MVVEVPGDPTTDSAFDGGVSLLEDGGGLPVDDTLPVQNFVLWNLPWVELYWNMYTMYL